MIGGNSLPDSIHSWVKCCWRYISVEEQELPFKALAHQVRFFLYVFLSPSLDKKRGQTESSNSEGENKGKDNRLLGPSNPENKTRAGRVSTCCKTELGIYPGHCQVFFRMSAIQSDRLGTIPEPHIDAIKTSPISPNTVDPEGLVREYRHRTSGCIHFQTCSGLGVQRPLVSLL